MLRFFRKHQRFFFIIIAFFIIVTFAFFGTNTSLREVKKVKDKQIAVALDGSKIKLSDIDVLSYFIATDSSDTSVSQNSLRPNLFNDGVLRNDFIQSGLAKALFEKYFDKLKPSLKRQFTKVQSFTPYSHFYNSDISAKSVWENFNPTILEKLNEIQKEKEVSIKFVSLLIDLYLEEMKFPSEYLKRILIYQERQSKSRQQDIRLYQDDLSLFGFKNAMEWFGKDFLDLVSQVIINSSVVASQNGYKVSESETLLDMTQNFKTSLKKYQFKGSINEEYSKQLKMLSLNEKSAVKAWRRVLLFRRYFEDVSNNVLVDNLAYKDFVSFALKRACINKYTLPSYLKINNFNDLMHLEMYLKATTDSDDFVQNLPNKFLSVNEIEKKHPELIEKKYLINVKETNLEKASLKIKVRDMYQWQLENKNWAKLKNKFFFLKNAKSKEERLVFLDKLDFEKRSKLDAFSRKEMMSENPNFIKNALLDAKVNKLEVFISAKNSKLPFKLKTPSKLTKLFETRDKIENYSEDQNTFYSFHIVKRNDEKHLISYEKAKNSKVIDSVLNEFLKEKYTLLKQENPERFENSFEASKKDIFMTSFPKVLEKLQAHSKDKSLDSLAKYRLYSYFQNTLAKLKENPKYLFEINEMWRLKEEKIELARTKKPNWIEKQSFAMKEKSFSKINITKSDNFEFIYLDHFDTSDAIRDKVAIAKRAIAFETSELLLKQLMKTFDREDLIVVPVR